MWLYRESGCSCMCIIAPLHVLLFIYMNSGTQRREASYSSSRPLFSLSKKKKKKEKLLCICFAAVHLTAFKGRHLTRDNRRHTVRLKLSIFAFKSRNAFWHPSGVIENVVFAWRIVADHIFLSRCLVISLPCSAYCSN